MTQGRPRCPDGVKTCYSNNLYREVTGVPGERSVLPLTPPACPAPRAPASPHLLTRATTTYIGFLPLEFPPGSHAPGMCLDDQHCPPLGLNLQTHQVAPAEGLQLDHPLPHGLVLPGQHLAPGDGLQAFKTQEDLRRQKGCGLTGVWPEAPGGQRRPS